MNAQAWVFREYRHLSTAYITSPRPRCAMGGTLVVIFPVTRLPRVCWLWTK